MIKHGINTKDIKEIYVPAIPLTAKKKPKIKINKRQIY